MNPYELDTLDNLHTDLMQLVGKKKLNVKSAQYISALDIDAEQLWVLRYYSENSVLPTIKQAREIWETHERKKLTVRALRSIMATSLTPKKVVFDYSDLKPFFNDYMTPEEIRQDVLKVLSYWKNNFNK